MLWSPVLNIRQTRTISHVHWRETPSGGQWEKRGAALARELTCHSTATCCSRTIEPLGEPHQEEKPVGEWVSSIFSEEKTLVYPPWPLCHPWILFTPREVFSRMDPPLKVPLLCLALSPHSQGIFSSVFCLIFLSAKPREMLPKHCKSIRALNIYYKMAGGLRGSDVRD